MKRIVSLFSFFLHSILISHAQNVWVGNNSYGGYSLPNNITISANALNCFIGGLNTSGTNTFAGDIVLNSSTQLESFAGGIAQFRGNISGPHGITIDEVGESGNGIVQYSGVPKTYTGVTIINNGATLRISSNQSLEDIILNTGGKLIVDAGVKLTVNGSWTGGGELENNGIIELIGGNFFPGSATTVTAMNILQVNRSGTVNLDNNLTITGSLILTAGNFDINPGRVLTLNDANLVNAAGFLVGSATSDLIVTGASGGTVQINNAIALRNILVDGTRTVSLNGTNDLTLYGNLNISANATLNSGGDASQITNNGAAAINLSGTFITQHPGGFIGTGSAIPTVPVTINNNSTVDFGRLGDQQITATPSYFNIRFSGSGIKTPDNAISVHTNGLVTITGTCTVDATNNNIGSTGPNTTALQMSSGIFKVGTAETLPLMRGTYTITGGTIQYVGGSSKNIRSTAAYDYQNIEILGTNVNNGAGNISLNGNGTFTVKSGGAFTINNNAIIGTTGIQTVTIETNSRFNTANLEGFYGPIVSGNSPSIRNTVENLVLQPGSTVSYSRSDPPLSGANQVITNTHTYQNLEISGNGIKTPPLGATLTIQGNLIKSGSSTFQPNNGLVLLNGSGSQTFAGLPYSRLQLTNGSKTTSGSASIDSLLKIDASTTLNVSSGDSIVILSTANRTASMGRMQGAINYLGTGLTAGKFVVQRYLLSGRKWRLLSVPTNNINQTVRNSWQENGVDNAGFGFRALDTRSNWASLGYDGLGNNSSIKKFNAITESWDAIENTNVMPLQTDSAYFVFVPGDRSITFPGYGSTTLRTRGQLITGNVGPINVPDRQFAVIGNPYASRIDIRNINFTGLGIDQSITVWDPSLTTGYGLGAFNQLLFDGTSYRNQLSSAVYGPFNTPNNFIESGQAFVVRATGNSSITFNEDDKELGSNLASFVAGDPQQLRVHLKILPNGGSPVLLDGVMTQFDTSYSKSVDYLDIKKINPFGETVSWNVADALIVVERRASVVATDTLQLRMGNLRVQNYQWELIAENMDFPGRTGFLLDRYLNTSTPINMAGTTTVNFNVANVAGSYAADRFKIVFRQDEAGPLPVTFTTVTANRNADRSVAVQWKVEQEINIVGYVVERSKTGSNFNLAHNRTATGNNSSIVTYDHIDLTPYSGDNFYRIKATSVDGQVQYSNIVKLNGGKSTPIISVYPNPVVNKQLQLRFEEQEKGRYQVQLMNMKGQVLLNKTVNVLNTFQAETIELSASLAAGNYQLVATAPNGNSIKQTVLVQ